jgi:hypothetical protein
MVAEGRGVTYGVITPGYSSESFDGLGWYGTRPSNCRARTLSTETVL